MYFKLMDFVLTSNYITMPFICFQPEPILWPGTHTRWWGSHCNAQPF